MAEFLPIPGQLPHRRLKDLLQRPEAVHQRVGKLVGVPARDGIKEQQLQQIDIVEIIKSVCKIPRFQSFPVSVVYTHYAYPLSNSIFYKSMVA